MSSKRSKNLKQEEWRELSELLDHALSLPETKRKQFVVDKTEAHSPIRQELLSLLDVQGTLADFLERPVGNVKASLSRIKTFSPGDRIDDFKIEGILGVGGAATVYCAHEISLNRRVALKISADRGIEAKTAAQLDHDNIARVFSETVDPKKHLRLICMQFVPGVSLQEIIPKLAATKMNRICGRDFLEIVDGNFQDEKGPARESIQEREKIYEYDFVDMGLYIGGRIAEALAYAHSKGVLHLDVKPSNILFSRNARPLLTDFGVSMNVAFPEEGLKNFGGTFEYMSPEQLEVFLSKDRKSKLALVDERSDLYSLGLVIRNLFHEPHDLAQARAFGGPISLGSNSIEEAYEAFDRVILSPAVPKSLPRNAEADEIVHHCLEKDPTKRFQTANELANALNGCLELRYIQKRLPRSSRLLHFMEKWPLLCLIVMGGLPQAVTVAKALWYNNIRIVPYLSAEELRLFKEANFLYIPTMFLLGSATWLLLVHKIRPLLKAPGVFLGHSEELSTIRRHVQRLPWWGVFLTSLGWLPSALLPWALKGVEGPLSTAVEHHFWMAIAIDYLIAASFSFLVHEYFVLRILYPKCWLGIADIQKQAASELKGHPKAVSVASFLCGWIPLVGAGIIVFGGPDSFDQSSYEGFKGLVIIMILIGGLGFLLGEILATRLYTTLFALTGGRKNLKK